MATSLYKYECNKMMKRIQEDILPVLGINRNLPLIIGTSTKLYQGLGIPDFWTVQQGNLKL
jgi:hypothetical protein